MRGVRPLSRRRWEAVPLFGGGGAGRPFKKKWSGQSHTVGIYGARRLLVFGLFMVDRPDRPIPPTRVTRNRDVTLKRRSFSSGQTEGARRGIPGHHKLLLLGALAHRRDSQ